MPGGVGSDDGVIHHRGKENIDHRAGLGSSEILPCDADDGEEAVADAKGAIEDLWVVAEAASPVVVGENGIRMRIEFEIVGFGEEAADGGLQAEDGKHLAGDVL